MSSAPRPRQNSTELSELVGALMMHVNRRSAGDSLALMSEVGLTMAQLVTLYMLGHAGPQTVGGIATRLRLSPAATSHLVDQLVREGLVDRTESPADRRQKRVQITARGRRLTDELCQERARELGNVLGHLSPTLRRQFAEILRRVIAEIASLPEERS